MVNIISAILVGKNAEITVMALEGSLKDYLLRGKELSDDEISALKDRLCSKTGIKCPSVPGVATR